MINSLPSFNELYAFGENIRLHGNRFIQIDVGLRTRVHLWSDIIPMAQQRPAPIHDHDYNFESRILSGQLVNCYYRIAHTIRSETAEERYNGMCHDIWNVDRKQGILVKTDKTVILKLADIAHYRTNGIYNMHYSQLHATTYIGHAITCVKATPQLSNRIIRVMVPHRIEPDNDFKRDQYSQDYLWDIVQQIYSGIGKGPLSLDEVMKKLQQQTQKVR